MPLTIKLHSKKPEKYSISTNTIFKIGFDVKHIRISDTCSIYSISVSVFVQTIAIKTVSTELQ